MDLGDETLLTAEELANFLKIDVAKVYALPIDKIVLSKRRTRWKLGDVRGYLASVTVPAPMPSQASPRIPAAHPLRYSSLARVAGSTQRSSK